MRVLIKSFFFLFVAFFFLYYLAIPTEAADNVSRSPNIASWAPRIAVDSAGNLHVVWAEYYSAPTHEPNMGSGDAFYAKYDNSTQQWSIPINLSNTSQVNSAEYRPVGIDIDSSDNIYVVYIDYKTSIKLRTLSGGNWSSPFVIHSGSEEIDCARVAVDASGNIFTTWWTIHSGIVYSRARVGGNWESVKPISAPGRRSKFPDIAVGNNEVWVSFVQRDPAEYYCYYIRRSKSFDASWSYPVIVYPRGGGQEFPAIEIDGNETPHLIWMTIFNPEAFQRVTSYSYWTGSGWTPAQTISSSPTLSHYPSLHERGNNIYAAWQWGAWGNGEALLYNTRIGGSWTGQGSAANSRGVTYLDVATSPSQNQIYFVWDAAGEIWCNMGTTGPPVEPNEPPIAEFNFSPATGVFPLQVTFDASDSRDPDGNIVGYSWDFGDGASGSGRVVTHVYNRWGTFSIRLTVRDDKNATGSKIRTIEIFRLFQPLNIRWESHADESLFMTRYVTEVRWESNPENDRVGTQIVLHRIFRKKSAESGSAFVPIAEVRGDVFRYLDTDNISSKGLHTYTVTVVDSEGHESPIIEVLSGIQTDNKPKYPGRKRIVIKNRY